jgi:excisionase family DNA binding protein
MVEEPAFTIPLSEAGTLARAIWLLAEELRRTDGDAAAGWLLERYRKVLLRADLADAGRDLEADDVEFQPQPGGVPGLGDSAELYTAAELAELAGVTTQAVSKAIRTGRIKATRLADGWRIPAGEADEFVQARKIKESA